jgi:UDP-glucose 4-epimerase
VGKVIAITGAAGYIGQTLIAQLLTQSWVERIIALDLEQVSSGDLVISYAMDMRESTHLRAILAEHAVTHLVHAAFVISPSPGMSDSQMYTTNVEGSKQVIDQALGYGVEQLLFISSVAIYGYHPGQAHPLDENADLRPTMLYGRHKAAVEIYLRGQNAPKTNVAVVRPSAVVGPRGRSRSHLRALTAQPMFVLANGGKALTQALHEQDMASLLVAAIQHDISGTFNAAPSDNLSWAEIARLSKLPLLSLPRAALNFATRFNRIVPALKGFTREVVDLFSETLVVDNTAVRQQTGWIPRYTTRDAFAEMFGAPERELTSEKI